MIAVPLTTVTQTLATYLGIYSILSVITVVLGAIAIRLLVTLAFRSLTQVENTAMEIAAGDFGQRMTDIAPGTEVGRLKTAINAMLGRIDAALAQRDATVRQMRRFVGDASHELRTPLVTVRGYAELYRMGAIRTDQDVAQSMERIEKEAMRMGLLVEDLLALARLDERRDIEFAPVDLRPLARDAALDVRAASPQRPVAVIDTTIVEPTERPAPQTETNTLETPKRPRSAFSRAGSILLRRRPRDARGTAPTTEQIVIGPLDLGPSSSAPVALPPIVLGEENRIRQVITNLIGNARRFTAEDSPIELRIGVDAAAQSGWIEIVDHGEGVPDQIKDKIFQRFWRADTSRTRETGGSGLGLSIVASIVESLHGSVRVMDTPGGGATFRVGFPLARHIDPAEHAFLETQPLDRLPADLRSEPPA
jgi:two-component system OmpR family sensor kinase